MPLRMPVEHGAWGMLAVPFVCAAAVAGTWNAPLLLCGVAALGLFVLRGSVDAYGGWRALRRPEHIGLATVCLVAALTLLLRYSRLQLLYLGAAAVVWYAVQLAVVNAHEENRSDKRSLVAELIGVGLLSLTAPAAWIAAQGRLDSTGTQVWILNALFFLGGVLYVKYRVRGLLAHRTFDLWRERMSFAWPVWLYHLVLLAWLAGMALFERHWWPVMIAFVPGILRAGALAFQLGRRFPIRRLGWTEVAHAVVFAALLVAAFRLGR